ncbi:MAG TPA: hypothetical protein VI451_08810, partial [Anaerolineales bacterium]|nr:hypothetical protein [Anaerolineales bacterium]
MFAFSPDDSKITFLFSQDRTLSQQLFTFDPATGQQRLVAQLQNREGVTLYGALYHPPQAGDGPLPLIVSVYGGPHAQLVVNRWGMAASMRAQYLSQQG